MSVHPLQDADRHANTLRSSTTSRAVAHALNVGYSHGMYQHRREIEALSYLLLAMNVRSVLEIGGHRGGTAALWCELAPEIVISIDLPTGPWGGIGESGAALRDRTLAKAYPHYRAIHGDSHEAATRAQVRTLLGSQKVDFLFIDGDHSYAGVKADYEDYRQFVRAGGVIGFHDIIDTKRHRDDKVDVPQFWTELASPSRDWIVYNDAQGWGGIGVLYV